MTASNRDEITRQIATLQDRHGEAPVEREDLPFEVPAEPFREVVESARTGTVNSSYVWVRRTPDQFPGPSASSPDSAVATRPRVLLIYNRADDHAWTVPGGEQETGESLAETARRELREETATEATLTGLEDSTQRRSADRAGRGCPVQRGTRRVSRLRGRLRGW